MICISTTSNSEIILKKIASEVLNNKLSACTQIYKISQSGYKWEDEIVYNFEFKLDIKTDTELSAGGDINCEGNFIVFIISSNFLHPLVI